jgi:hypothetical protein
MALKNSLFRHVVEFLDRWLFNESQRHRTLYLLLEPFSGILGTCFHVNTNGIISACNQILWKTTSCITSL